MSFGQAKLLCDATDIWECSKACFPCESSRCHQRAILTQEICNVSFCVGEDAIRHLLSRGTHREFGYGALTVMLIYYFLGAVWAAGSAIASGVFVPMLMIGSCIGRFVGLVVVNWCAARGYGSGELYATFPATCLNSFAK